MAELDLTWMHAGIDYYAALVDSDGIHCELDFKFRCALISVCVSVDDSIGYCFLDKQIKQFTAHLFCRSEFQYD